MDEEITPGRIPANSEQKIKQVEGKATGRLSSNEVIPVLGSTYKFSSDEVKTVCVIARARQESNKKENKVNRNITGINDLELHTTGVAGEYAFEL